MKMAFRTRNYGLIKFILRWLKSWLEIYRQSSFVAIYCVYGTDEDTRLECWNFGSWMHLTGSVLYGNETKSRHNLHTYFTCFNELWDGQWYVFEFNIGNDGNDVINHSVVKIDNNFRTLKGINLVSYSI